MEKRTLGKTGLEVTALGYGSSEIGFGQSPTSEVEKILSAALDAGLNVIDTAECYGTAEERIGEAVSHRRGEYYLFTKCGHAAGLARPDWDPEMLEESIDRSLKRLKTDYVDLLQLHTCSEELLRKGDVIAVAQRARDAGKARFIGYSGDNAAALYAVTCGAFDTLQTSVSVTDQSIIYEVLPAAAGANIGVIAKRPISNAVFAYASKPDNGYHLPYWERLQELDYPFLAAGSDTAANVALRFTLSSIGVHTAIVGTTKPKRWSANARILNDGPLPAAEYAAIRRRWGEVATPDWVGLA